VRQETAASVNAAEHSRGDELAWRLREALDHWQDDADPAALRRRLLSIILALDDEP